MAGACWHLETPELEALAKAEQAARFVVDAWDEPIRKYVGARLTVKLPDVFKHALGLAQPEQWTQAMQKRVVAILTSMGFTKRRPRTAKGREFRYERDPLAKK